MKSPHNKVRKPDTVESLRKELKEERRLKACSERDYQQMLSGRDAQIVDLKRSNRDLQFQLENAGKHFNYLRTSLSLIAQVGDRAENLAAHFAGAYAPQDRVVEVGQ